MFEVATHFNRAAQDYEKEASVQELIGSYLLEMMAKEKGIRSFKDISLLELGCGTARDCKLLMKQFAIKNYLGIDGAKKMYLTAKSHYQHHDTIDFSLQDFDDDLSAIGAYDILYANMSLHWSRDFKDLINRLKLQLKQPGYLCFSIPLQHTFRELSNFRINHFKSHASIIKLLTCSGYELCFSNELFEQVSFPNQRCQLKHLKKTGVDTYVGSKTYNLSTVRQYLNINKPASLTYHIGVYICAIR